MQDQLTDAVGDRSPSGHRNPRYPGRFYRL
jgi:hypothetical protein